MRIDRVESGEDHGLDVFKAGHGFDGGMVGVGDGVADLHVADGLHGGEEEADFAGGEFADLLRLGGEHAHGVDQEGGAFGHELDLLALVETAVDHAGEDADAAIAVKPGVKDEGLQRRIDAALGRRNAVHDLLENFDDARAGFGADGQSSGGVEADGAFDHLLGALDVRAGQIDFVDDGNDFEAVVDGDVAVGQGLRLDALRGIDHQQRAFAGGQRAGDLVGEIDVAGGVDEIELIGLAVFGQIHHADGVGLDGDAALALQFHGVEDLLLAGHLAGAERAGDLQHAVGERGLAVVDVRDDREVPNRGAVHALLSQTPARIARLR